MGDNDNQNNEGTQSETPQAGQQQEQTGSAQQRIIEHVKLNKIDCALWGTRMLTILFAIGYLIPIFG